MPSPAHSPQGVTARDLLQTAVMHNQRLTRIIATDAQFDLVEGLTRLDPQALFAQRE